MKKIITSENSFKLKFDESVDLKLLKKLLQLKEYYEMMEHVNHVQLGYDEILVEYTMPFDDEFEVSEISLDARLVTIPVCYDACYGFDMMALCSEKNLKAEDIIELHTSVMYPVHLIGFLFGFPYLSGLDSVLHTPRKATPNLKIPEGSVGIGGNQTGIYPLESPGGWHIIGRTPIKLYDVKKKMTLLRPGDMVQFKSISKEEFKRIDETYEVEISEIRI